ncbi:ECF transporter S component [Streptococcus cuniculipharyngis]|uniref:ECF transporter S component n=1 Tax=Streptococcus cuniculipharyngis TaxID=1562651 RepID=A0A5C5S8R8_9STRE|nr:ECF transporter S component [Streptococcus cuniculipharyngis]TWS96279.1 ECF transporter S component [Streptococcus cuniculipharyngis]
MKTRTNRLTVIAILTALSLVLGRFIMIPTPNGFLTLLDAGIYFTAFYFGKKEGAIVGGLAAFLLDLLAGYPQWMFISLFAHGAQGYLAAWSGRGRWLGLSLASLVMVGTYFLASWGFYGLGAALADVLGNFLQNVVGMALGFTLAKIFSKT